MCRWWDMPWLGRTAVQWQCSSWQGWPMDWHCGQGAGKLSVSKNACGKHGASPLLPGKHFSLYKSIHPKLFVRLAMEDHPEKWRCLEKWARSPDHPQGLQAVYATIFDVQQKQTSWKSFLVFGFIWFHSIRSRLHFWPHHWAHCTLTFAIAMSPGNGTVGDVIFFDVFIFDVCFWKKNELQAEQIVQGIIVPLHCTHLVGLDILQHLHTIEWESI